jgi:sulfite reductase alpha subunit-like flavoprotein
LLVFIPTYEDGTPPPSAKWFLLYLQEAATDFRVSKNELAKLTYAVFGCGNSLYHENFNQVKSRNFQRYKLKHLFEIGSKRN